MFVTNSKILGAVVPEKLWQNILLEKKEKWTNKGNDKQEDAESGLHKTSTCTQC